MTEARNYPVLPLDDAVVLPGMVVPIELDADASPSRSSEIRAAIDAAQLADTPVLIVPRPGGRYATVGTLASIEQIGRLPGGQPAAVLRGTVPRLHRHRHHRPRCGALGRGDRDRRARHAMTTRCTRLAREYKGLVTSILHQRGASQLVDSITRITDPRCWPTPPATRRT